MNTTISENIRKFRELRGFSQDYMAHKMNLSQSAYAKIEKENTKLTVDRLQSISEILEVDVASLINASKQNIFNQYNNQTALGYVENYTQQENQVLKDKLIEQYEVRLREKEQELQALKDALKT